MQAQCASLRITDCGQLMREASRDSILRDDVCMAQCGFLLEPTPAAAAPQLAQPIDFAPPPSPARPSRPSGPSGRQLPPELLAPPPPFRRGPPGPSGPPGPPPGPPRSAARRNPRILRPGPSPFPGLRIPDFSSILG